MDSGLFSHGLGDKGRRGVALGRDGAGDGGGVASGSLRRIGFFPLGRRLEVTVAWANGALRFSSRQALGQGGRVRTTACPGWPGLPAVTWWTLPVTPMSGDPSDGHPPSSEGQSASRKSTKFPEGELHTIIS